MRALVVLVVFGLGCRARAEACAVAPPAGAHVAIAAEEALIGWDPATKTETFVRRSTFRSSAATFGFLVPTPTVPVITEESDALFAALAKVTLPEVRHVRKRRFVPSSIACVTLGKDARAPMATSGAVRELQTVHVAGFDAITVEADDPAALADWLAKHSFATTPELQAWLARYVETKWKLTAFVFRSDDAANEVGTKAISMKFQTERPFYPYREPASQETDPTRLLRVFFTSADRFDATLAGSPWRAKVSSSTKLPTTVAPELAGVAGLRLTVFEDEGTRDGVDEVYFARSADQAETKPPVQVIEYEDEVPIPVDVIVILGLIAGWAVRRVRRSTAARRSGA